MSRDRDDASGPDKCLKEVQGMRPAIGSHDRQKGHERMKQVRLCECERLAKSRLGHPPGGLSRHEGLRVDERIEYGETELLLVPVSSNRESQTQEAHRRR